MDADTSLSFVTSQPVVGSTHVQMPKICKIGHKCKWVCLTTKPQLYICFYVHKQTSSSSGTSRLTVEIKNNTLQCLYLFLKRECTSSCFPTKAVKKKRKKRGELTAQQLVDVDTKSSLWCQWERHFTPLWPVNGQKFRTVQKQLWGMSVHIMTTARSGERQECSLYLSKKPPITVSPVHSEQLPNL